MSLFQCENCGCCENTATSFQGCHGFFARNLDWSEFPEREGKRVCSACAPAMFKDGSETGLGEWHNEFNRTFLPIGEFRTDEQGNLEHIKTGSKDWAKWALVPELTK